MTKLATLDSAQTEIVDSLIALSHVLRVLHTDATPWLDLDLTMAQLKALLVVVQTDGVSSRGIGERLRISAPAVTPLVDRLIDHKLVRREDDPSDRRVILIRPTPRGLALYEKLMETSRATVAAVVERVPQSEIARVEEALVHLLGAARDVLASAPRHNGQ